MRNLIFVAVILHVAFTVAGLQLDGKEVEFGDIIAYKPQCKLALRYQPYTTFVGDKYPGQSNTFEHSNERPSCIFSPINMSRGPYVFNFLDGYVDKKGKAYTKGSETEMKARIDERRVKCGSNSPLCNNCEHLATYVRYGEKISLQFNMTGQDFCNQHPTGKDMWKYVKELNGASSVNPVGLTSLCLIALFLCDMSF